MIFAVDCLWNLINIKINVTPLHSAAGRGYIEIVQLLLAQKGIKINCTALIFTLFVVFMEYGASILFYTINLGCTDWPKGNCSTFISTRRY